MQENIAVGTLIACALVSALGVLMIAAGLLGLLQAAQFPALAAPSLVWPLLIVGALLDMGAVLQLLSVLKRRRASG